MLRARVFVTCMIAPVSSSQLHGDIRLVAAAVPSFVCVPMAECAQAIIGGDTRPELNAQPGCFGGIASMFGAGGLRSVCLPSVLFLRWATLLIIPLVSSCCAHSSGISRIASIVRPSRLAHSARVVWLAKSGRPSLQGGSFVPGLGVSCCRPPPLTHWWMDLRLVQPVVLVSGALCWLVLQRQVAKVPGHLLPLYGCGLRISRCFLGSAICCSRLGAHSGGRSSTLSHGYSGLASSALVARLIGLSSLRLRRRSASPDAKTPF